MNPFKGEAELVIPDQGRFTLVFDYEALIVAEATYGQPVGITSFHADQGFVGALRALLFGATRAHHRDVTLSDATDMVFRYADAVREALDKAAQNSMPPADDAAEGRKDPRPSRRGTNSGANGAKQGSTPTGSGGRRRAASK